MSLTKIGFRKREILFKKVKVMSVAVQNISET